MALSRVGRELKQFLGAEGLVLWEGPSLIGGHPIVVIATGVVPKSTPNGKTGNVVQTWILLRDVPPIESLKTGEDEGVCGDCKLRPQGEGSRLRACYVNIGIPHKTWEAWRRGLYPPIGRFAWHEDRLFGGRVIRLGSYGDPAAVPADFWRGLVSRARGWVGYTHQWRTCDPALKDLVMASVDSPGERAEAKAGDRPWRTFRTRFSDEPLLDGEIACPAAEEWWGPRGIPKSRRAHCEKCRLCDGVQYLPDSRRDVAIVAHGWSPAVRAYVHARERGSLPVIP